MFPSEVTILVAVCSFAVGSVSTLFAMSRGYVTKSECRAHKEGCMKAAAIVESNTSHDVKLLFAKLDSQERWLRLIASKLNVVLD